MEFETAEKMQIFTFNSSICLKMLWVTLEIATPKNAILFFQTWQKNNLSRWFCQVVQKVYTRENFCCVRLIFVYHFMRQIRYTLYGEGNVAKKKLSENEL